MIRTKLLLKIDSVKLWSEMNFFNKEQTLKIKENM